MRPMTIPHERPMRTMTLDGLSSFVPSIEAGARALRREVARARAAFLPTDMENHQHDAAMLENLAHRLDVRRVP